ncbi:MAG: ATP-binding protein, partial [Chloroflexi bacterium]|nr:ATP-binding protein [Chloroflexota bacterium]
MSVQALEQIEKIGEKRDTIHVRLSYRIIELFSGGLYSSPNKAIEELVANSYDAYASRVHIILSANLKGPDAFIAVVDDGESMNLQELHDLWLIAGSTKRDKPPRGRLPIGKFGIGKLATYVLATKLTHVCKKDGRYLTVTMDYGRIPPTGIAT